MRRKGSLLLRLALFVLVLILAPGAMWLGYILGRPAKPHYEPQTVEVTVINVGEGVCSLLRTPGGRFVLIGSGPPGAGAAILRALKAADAPQVDLLILPYPYSEAIGGVPEVMQGISVVQAVESAFPRAGHAPLNRDEATVRALLAAQQVRVRPVRAGDQVTLDGVRIEFLAPGATAGGPPINHAGDGSVVVRAVWRDTAFLWAGGLERAGEIALLARGAYIRSNWLQVARFGSREATTPEFLRQVMPEMAVVSGGPNSGGYPHAETLARLQATGATLYRTDQSRGDLHFSSDGDRVTGP